MGKFLKGRLASFKPAFSGIAYAFRNEPNLWIHSLISLAIVVVGLWLGLTRVEWAVLALTMGLVFAVELLNTALETLVDLVSPDFHPLAGAAKDISAAAVTLAALAAVVIGLLILGPPLWALLF